MNFYNQKCTHCGRVFVKDDDIVVCPVCGTPQHRECYEEENRCINFDKHAENYVWSPSDSEDGDTAKESSSKMIVCPNCGTQNAGDAFFCKHCSVPLNGSAEQNNTEGFNPNMNTEGMPPFGNATFVSPFGNIKNEDKIAENVTIGEAKTYVKSNDLFYSFIFKRIHDLNRSRFNFAAFIFSGGWFLYRKQYGIGIIITLLMGICMVGYDIGYMALVNFINVNGLTTQTELCDALIALPTNEMLIYLSSGLFRLAQYIIMFVCGFIGNRSYYKHVVKKVTKAKEEFESEAEVRKILDKKGGTDRVLGIILLIGAIVLTILPRVLVFM